MTSFVHLHVRSEFSLKDSIVRVDELVAASIAAKMPAVGMTDLMNLYALVKFYQGAQGKGIKPLFGADLVLREGEQRFEVCALVMNETGYRNLINVISRAYVEGQELGESTLRREWLEEAGEGLILLLGKRSDIGAALLGADAEQTRPVLARWMQKFPQRIYLELTRTSRDGEEDFLHAAVALAAELQCPVVATNDVRFLVPEDFEAHEVRVCIAQSHTLDDPRRPRRWTVDSGVMDPGSRGACHRARIRATRRLGRDDEIEIAHGRSRSRVRFAPRDDGCASVDDDLDEVARPQPGAGVEAVQHTEAVHRAIDTLHPGRHRFHRIAGLHGDDLDSQRPRGLYLGQRQAPERIHGVAETAVSLGGFCLGREDETVDVAAETQRIDPELPLIAAGGRGRRRKAIDGQILRGCLVDVFHPAGIEIIAERLFRRNAHDVEAHRLRAAFANADHGLRGVFEHETLRNLESETQLRMQEAAATYEALAGVFAVDEVVDGGEIGIAVALDACGRRILACIGLRILHPLGRCGMRRQKVQRARIGEVLGRLQRGVALHRCEEAGCAERIELGA